MLFTRNNLQKYTKEGKNPFGPKLAKQLTRKAFQCTMHFFKTQGLIKNNKLNKNISNISTHKVKISFLSGI